MHFILRLSRVACKAAAAACVASREAEPCSPRRRASSLLDNGQPGKRRQAGLRWLVSRPLFEGERTRSGGGRTGEDDPKPPSKPHGSPLPREQPTAPARDALELHYFGITQICARSARRRIAPSTHDVHDAAVRQAIDMIVEASGLRIAAGHDDGLPPLFTEV